MHAFQGALFLTRASSSRRPHPPHLLLEHSQKLPWTAGRGLSGHWMAPTLSLSPITHSTLTYHSLHTVMLTMYCHFLFCFRKKHLAPGRCIFLIHNFQESSSFWKQKDSSTLRPTISAPASFGSYHQEIPQISKHKSIFGSSFFILETNREKYTQILNSFGH